MKSQRRHDLKQNTLDATLARIITFVRERGNQLAWGLLGLAVIVFLLVLYNKRASEGEAQLQRKFDDLVVHPDQQTPVEERIKGLIELGKEEDDEGRLAQVFYTLGGIYAQQMVDGGGPVVQKDLADEAGRWYSRVVEECPDQKEIVAKAHYALAKLAEGARDTERAAREYGSVLAMTELRGYPVFAMAQQARDALEKVVEPVRMASTAPAPTDEPTSQAATASAPATTTSAPAAAAPAATTQPAAAP